MHQHFTKYLRAEFLNKIDQDWSEKYVLYGTIDDIKQQTNLAKAIEADIYKELGKSRRDKGSIPSWGSINNYLLIKGLGPNPKRKTLDIFSNYIGYNNFEDFKTNSAVTTPVSEDSQILDIGTVVGNTAAKDITIIKPGTEPIYDSLKSTGNIERFSLKTKSIVSCFGILFFLIVYLIYKNHQLSKNFSSATISSQEESEIKSIIEKGNEIEYNLYKSIPQLSDTSLLTYYYTNQGSGRKNIITTLKRLKSNSVILDTDDSKRELNANEIYLNRINEKTIKAKTVEKWRLSWKDSISGRSTTIYDVLNNQLYHLVKTNEGWRIEDNKYDGKATHYLQSDSYKPQSSK